MDETDDLRAARTMRRAILGDVRQPRHRRPDPIAAEFQLHVSSAPHTGVTDNEIDELLFQIAAYCGAPAGVAARRAVRAVRAGREGS
jgi:alkylhydroperoxidase/carboxymuconolactone decarboxylase family protein YurZ